VSFEQAASNNGFVWNSSGKFACCV